MQQTQLIHAMHAAKLKDPKGGRELASQAVTHANTIKSFVAKAVEHPEFKSRPTHALDQRLMKAFPLLSPEEERLFKLLRDAYIDARYKKGYCITGQKLNWLGERVRVLEQLTDQLCHEKMQYFLTQEQSS